MISIVISIVVVVVVVVVVLQHGISTHGKNRLLVVPSACKDDPTSPTSIEGGSGRCDTHSFFYVD